MATCRKNYHIVTFRPLVKQMTTRNLYITIYIYFLDGRLCEVGAVRRGIRIVHRWGLSFPMSGDDGRDNAHCVTTREVSWTAGSFFSIFFCSIRRPYITFKLPRRDKDTRLRLCNLPGLRRLGCVTSAHLEWPVWLSSSWKNYHAVHRSISSGASLSLRHSENFYLVSYCEPSCILQYTKKNNYNTYKDTSMK